MAFAQLTYRESLRDIEACFSAQPAKCYHLGIRGNVTRSNLGDANETRDWRIHCEFAQALIRIGRRLYAEEPLAVELNNTVYALDSTTIDLCLSLFPWAPFRNTKAAIKLHTLLDLRGNIPAFISSRTASCTTSTCSTSCCPSRGLLCDGSRLSGLRAAVCLASSRHFLRHAGQNQFTSSGSIPPGGSQHGTDLRSIYRTVEFYSQQGYPERLRRIRFKDPDTGKTLVFLTNHFGIPALTVCTLYKSRWQVELFFKWIKQHLRIKRFFGTSENAVKSQVWIAVATYVLVAILKKQRLKLELSLHAMLQILSVTPFEKTPLLQLLTDLPPIEAPTIPVTS